MKIGGPKPPRPAGDASTTSDAPTTRDAKLRSDGAGDDGAASARGDATPRKRELARRILARIGHDVSQRPANGTSAPFGAMRPHDVRGARGVIGVGTQGAPKAGVYAAIDLGSSSAKMLVQRVDVEVAGASARVVVRTLVDRKIGAALGKGVVPGEDIPDENQQRALDALRSFLDEAAQHGVDAADIPMITTAVVRNAPHGADFLARVHALGLTRARTLGGDEEAAMGFAGATLGLAAAAADVMTGGKPGRYATLDLGGGSFQLAIGTERGMEDGASTQVGSNVILDEMLAPRADAEGRGAVQHLDDVDALLATKAPMPLDVRALRGRTLVATGGVSKFLRAHFGKDVIARDEIDALRRDLVQMTYAERVAVVQRGKDEATRTALGVETHVGALEYGKKLPASSSLLLHILDALGLDEVGVSETDARHALVAARSREG